jgi:co-chaperonin GroES (HSP10)
MRGKNFRGEIHMFFCEIKKEKLSDGREILKVKKTKKGEVLSKFTIKIGDELVVKPYNKLKLKHRDRRVQILSFVQHDRLGLRAKVKFLDNNRLGFVEIEDLEELV